MASYTSNYQLHQWVPEDDFLRTDFNTDFQKIDTAIRAAYNLAAGKSAWVAGSYTGDTTVDRVINLGFHPQAVLVEQPTGSRGASNSMEGGLALRNRPVISSRADGPALSITTNGFIVTYFIDDEAFTNTGGRTYYYLALK